MTEPVHKSAGAMSLTQPVLFWVCHDPTHLVTVAIHQYLDSQTKFLCRRLAADQQPNNPSIGLIVWAIHETPQFSTTVSALMQSRKQNSSALLMVFLVPEQSQFRSALIEAGAHLVFHEISKIPNLISKCSGGLTVSREGIHPITTGLIARLPWAFAD